MRIWKQPVSVEELHAIHKDTAPEHLGMEFLEVGDDFIRGRIPVDQRTRQPYGLLHGGVSVVLAETLGSCGAAYACPEGHRPPRWSSVTASIPRLSPRPARTSTPRTT